MQTNVTGWRNGLVRKPWDNLVDHICWPIRRRDTREIRWQHPHSHLVCGMARKEGGQSVVKHHVAFLWNWHINTPKSLDAIQIIVKVHFLSHKRLGRSSWKVGFLKQFLPISLVSVTMRHCPAANTQIDLQQPWSAARGRQCGQKCYCETVPQGFQKQPNWLQKESTLKCFSGATLHYDVSQAASQSFTGHCSSMATVAFTL